MQSPMGLVHSNRGNFLAQVCQNMVLRLYNEEQSPSWTCPSLPVFFARGAPGVAEWGTGILEEQTCCSSVKLVPSWSAWKNSTQGGRTMSVSMFLILIRSGAIPAGRSKLWVHHKARIHLQAVWLTEQSLPLRRLPTEAPNEQGRGAGRRTAKMTIPVLILPSEEVSLQSASGVGEGGGQGGR